MDKHPDADTLTRFLLERSGVRGIVVHLDETWQQIAGRAHYPAEVAARLGETCAAAALFIAHHLVASADLERRRIPGFPTLFDTASKAVVQLALSIGFTGAFWILLTLGSALFKVIGLSFLEDLLRKEWFAIPVTFLVFATAVHLTDVRDGLIRGVRTVGLMLLSWLLLVMTVLIFAVMTALSPDKFLRYYNFESITYIFPELGLLSIAMMIAMLTGGAWVFYFADAPTLATQLLTWLSMSPQYVMFFTYLKA